MISADDLLAAARQVAEAAYAPYSNFRVGAAIECDAGVVTGCNVENASFGLSICAERAAVFAAVARGMRQIKQIAIACVDAAPDSPANARFPCGACRQVIAEFGRPDMPVHIDGLRVTSLGALLPDPFRLRP
jgi:cytidine deaminase